MTMPLTGIIRLLVAPVLLVIVSLSCAGNVLPGASVLLERHPELLDGKRVGVICNQTSRLPDGTHLVDALLARHVNVTALFAPEHGIRGFAAAGETVPSDTDSASGLTVHSLYGASKKPGRELLDLVDVLIFDLQDAGARYYTYASTMALAMEAAGEAGKEFIILDRPNPVNGAEIEGPVLDTAFRSFIGMFPIPVRHGLTLGELALMIAGEHWLDAQVNLQVIPMERWNRAMYYDETGLPWIPPSPNLKSVSAAIVYPGICLCEGTNVSEGRGTQTPFEMIGAPWIDGNEIAGAMKTSGLKGVVFRPVVFTPVIGSGSIPKYGGRRCGGVSIEVTDRQAFRPVQTALFLISSIQKSYPDSFSFVTKSFDRLAGTDQIRNRLMSGSISSLFTPERTPAFESYVHMRKKYLLY
jgi:uncharacterized protein YbbC (DUF1343 family)